jgi:hypothetical protein
MSKPGYKKARRIYKNQQNKFILALNNIRFSILILGFLFIAFSIHGIIYPDLNSSDQLTSEYGKLKEHLIFLSVGVLLLVIRFTLFKNKFGESKKI